MPEAEPIFPLCVLPGTCASLTPSRQGQVRGKCGALCGKALSR